MSYNGRMDDPAVYISLAVSLVILGVAWLSFRLARKRAEYADRIDLHIQARPSDAPGATMEITVTNESRRPVRIIRFYARRDDCDEPIYTARYVGMVIPRFKVGLSGGVQAETAGHVDHEELPKVIPEADTESFDVPLGSFQYVTEVGVIDHEGKRWPAAIQVG